MRKIKKLGLLGTGVIGGGWAARAMHAGIDVIATDINAKMEDKIQDSNLVCPKGVLVRPATPLDVPQNRSIWPTKV